MSLWAITLVLFLARINVAQIWLAVTLKKVESPSWKERRVPNELALAGDLIHLKAESSSGSSSLSPIKDQLACSLLAPAGETRSHCSGKFWGTLSFGVQAMRETAGCDGFCDTYLIMITFKWASSIWSSLFIFHTCMRIPVSPDIVGFTLGIFHPIVKKFLVFDEI